METQTPEGPGPWFRHDAGSAWPTPSQAPSPHGPWKRAAGSLAGRRSRPALIASSTGAALIVLAAGFGIGYVVRGRSTITAPSSLQPSSGGAATWQFTPASATEICRSGGGQAVLAALKSERLGPVPARLSDQMLPVSPVGDYNVAYDGPLTSAPEQPWEAIAAQEAVAGYARSYTSNNHAGGFAISAYEFPNQTAALDSAAAGYRAFVCQFGADPMTVVGHSGILAGIRPSQAVAMWVQGPRLVLVDYSIYGQRQKDLANALAAIRATWSRGGGSSPAA